MIHFFGDLETKVFAVQTSKSISPTDQEKLIWLFGNVPFISQTTIQASFVGPRAAMITPWSTNAVEITQNMGIDGIIRMEEFFSSKDSTSFDPMLTQKYTKLDQEIFTIHVKPEAILEIDNIAAYNQEQGLSLNAEEIEYLENLSKKMGRKLTDSEIFGFSQVNSEHCRHKIFNGTFVIDGETMPSSLFQMIKKTSQENPNDIVSAYKDNVAFIKGPTVLQFAPKSADKPDVYQTKEFESVISLKAETHNFPTTVEPFNGAATGSGGEIRDRLAGGQGSLPLAGTAVYMTPYSRLKDDRAWEQGMKERKWLYQTPLDILIKASNGASDFGNKFGQPLITGSVFTFEHEENNRKLGFDKVIMLAGGIGYGKSDQAQKKAPKPSDKIVVLGGDNYRIGMGGAAVSSADTGEFSSGIELNAIQRSNPEMQKRVSNAIRGFVEADQNPIVSIHDHGAGGHLNCLSELVEKEGGKIDLDKLPVGDPTLSAKEIIGNESQERMGLVIGKEHLEMLKKISDRERSPMFTVGEVTGDHRFTFESSKNGDKPMDLSLQDMFGSSPKTIMKDKTVTQKYSELSYDSKNIPQYLENVLKLESVACKDWLTNKVDRCVGGRVAKQPCVGSLQLPLNNVGVMALDYLGKEGIATTIGHSPISGLIDPVAGSQNSIAESLTNIIWAPLKNGLQSVSLSANWMWPCKNEGEDARLYKAVKAVSDFAIHLGINIPTGKDSLSMKQKYPKDEVISPGTVIISAVANCSEVSKVVEPVLQKTSDKIYYINFSQDKFKLGGSSFAQVLNKIGNEAARIQNPEFFKNAFNAIQEAIQNGWILAGHDVGSGGLITTLLEMCFADVNIGATLDLSALNEKDSAKLLFNENAGIVFQANAKIESFLKDKGIEFFTIGSVQEGKTLAVKNGSEEFKFDVATYRSHWYQTSNILDQKQTAAAQAAQRLKNYANQPLAYTFPKNFDGKRPVLDPKKQKIRAAIIREKGSNSEREMANAMAMAGFEVVDVHMTDLMSGRETLENIRFIGAVGGFSNSDVLGSAKGWAGAFKYNEKAKIALEKFFARKDTLSVGICNGCQLFVELGLINPDHSEKPKMLHNDSGKFECVFTSVEVLPNSSVMLGSFAGLKLGIWSAHGEGKFDFPYDESKYNIVGKFGYEGYPSNPNGSKYNTAMMVSDDGRHLVTMPHFERSTFPWNWAHYPKNRNDEVSPWHKAFQNAYDWLEKNGSGEKFPKSRREPVDE
jgi:phosphoribosylformylglycinamidine synthase